MQPIVSSVILCTRNRPDDVARFLPSLRDQVELPHELIVVDSSTTPLHDTAHFVAALQELQARGVRCIYAHTRPGLTYQRNYGISIATGDVFYFFDDDVILEPDYLRAMNMIFANHPHYAGGMGTVTNMAQRRTRLDRAVRRLFLLTRYDARGQFTASGMPTHAYGTMQFGDVETLGGCCMAYRRAVFTQNTFDEQFGGYAYMEDADMAYRVSRTARLFYNPQARLQHLHSPVSRDKREHNRAMFMCNFSYLFFKNIYPNARWRIIPYTWTVLGLFAHACLARDRAFFKGYARGLVLFYRTRRPAV